MVSGIDGDGPLVSCLMVTLAVPSRFAFACAAIDAFRRQTYHRRELVLVINGGSAGGVEALADHVAALGDDAIRVARLDGQPTLGAARNFSRAHAAGDVVCQWDDDDLHHPERLERQVGVLLDGGLQALLLADVLQYFPASRQIYWTNWQATPPGGHPGTLMAWADAMVDYPASGDASRLGEDLHVALALRARGGLGFLGALATLFVYVSHGGNSWHTEHHHRLAAQLAISPGLLRRREALVRRGLHGVPLGPGPVQVMGSSGPAFMLEPAGEAGTCGMIGGSTMTDLVASVIDPAYSTQT